MAERAVPTRKRSRSHTKRFCDHCSCYVSKSTWYNHREFRDPSTVSMAGLYSEVRVNVAEDPGNVSEFDFEASSSEDDSWEEAQLFEFEAEDDERIEDEESELKISESETSSGPELWSESDDEEGDDGAVDAGASPALKTVQVFAMFVLLWQSMFRVANVAVSMLFRFLSLFLNHISGPSQNENVECLRNIFPNSLEKAQKIARLNRNDFLQYVCCSKCSSIYTMDECFEQVGSRRIPKCCSSARFPRHPWPSMRGLCGAKLFKSVQISQKIVNKPIKVYCYKPILSSITSILSRPGMLHACEHWRDRTTMPGLYADVYDGKVWREFEALGFMSQPNSFGLILNIDWFEPFEHSIYAVGVVFLSLLNLPRQIRYDKENIILCGLIPGPKEPSLNVNSFLERLVQELFVLWRGKEIKLPSGFVTIRAALMCVPCDSPAMRKVGDFMSHAANKGCYKCMKSFPTALFGEKPDYSGFDRENWIPRTHEDTYDSAMKHKRARTLKERNEIERVYGVRYTSLISLLYYDAVRFCMIDPMHNLLLGSARTFVKLWKQVDGVSDDDLARIQKEVDAFVIPSGLGRLPRKVESGFANFKAEQWKNWTLIYSIICFKSVLNDSLYSMWLVFVQACALLCSRAISQDGITLADELIHKYCCLFQEQFGTEECYPNLHMHCHLKDCLLDYGPATSFWLFSFERMNGILGSYHTSNQSIEIQLFRKFIVTQQVHSAIWPDSELTGILKPLLNEADVSKDVTSSGSFYIHILTPFEKSTILAANKYCKILPPIKEKGFSVTDHQKIDSSLTTLFGEYRMTLILHKESKSIIFNGDLYGTFFSRQKNSSLILIQSRTIAQEVVRYPSFIVSFMQCTVVLSTDSDSTTTNELVMCKLVPLQESHQQHYYPKPVEVWKLPDTDSS